MDIAVAAVHESIAAQMHSADCIVYRERRLSWRDVSQRTRRLANYLLDHGFGCHTERHLLAPHQSGQDHLAIYLHNGNEYLEAMLGAFKARVAPVNINYRYTATELRYLLEDSQATAIIVHSRFVPVLAEAIGPTSSVRLILQVADESHQPLMPGAVWYEDALAAGSAEPVRATPSPDDLYILYTGGTTGMPKGVLWRNGDARVACFSGSETALAPVVDQPSAARRWLTPAPFMHGSGHWAAFTSWMSGGPIIIPWRTQHLDPDDVLRTCAEERVAVLCIVGDAMARPLITQLKTKTYRLNNLTVLVSGGAPLSFNVKAALHELLPTVMIIDGLGSSESGGHASAIRTRGSTIDGGFPLKPGAEILSADLTRVLPPTNSEVGWLAKQGRIALGYLGDAARSAATFPTIGGVRYVVPGDRASHRGDGTFTLYGRDSTTINSGGEKIFAEEVEAAVLRCPLVEDCVVAGRPSTRWGSEVVAIVQLDPAVTSAHDQVVDEIIRIATEHIARYKLPKQIIVVDRIARSDVGKADYRWAARVAAHGSPR